MTRKKGIGQEDKIDDHLRAIVILHNKIKKQDEFYYKAYVGDEIERLIKTLKKCKPSLFESIKN